MSRRTRRGNTPRDYPRTVRLNTLVQEIVAEEIERIDDDRLGLFTVVAVDVEADLHTAVVWYSALGASDDPEDTTVTDALAQHRPRLQAAIARQARIKRTPELSFRTDTVIQQAERVESILRDIADEPPVAPGTGPDANPATGP